MQGFVQGADRQQTTLLPECLDDWVDESNSIRAVDVFVDALELRDLGFDALILQRPAGRRTILRRCSSSTFTAISTGSIEPAAGARGWPQSRGDVADRTARARPQKPLPTSARTMAQRSRRFARNSSSCAARWAC